MLLTRPHEFPAHYLKQFMKSTSSHEKQSLINTGQKLLLSHLPYLIRCHSISSNILCSFSYNDNTQTTATFSDLQCARKYLSFFSWFSAFRNPKSLNLIDLTPVRQRYRFSKAKWKAFLPRLWLANIKTRVF